MKSFKIAMLGFVFMGVGQLSAVTVNEADAEALKKTQAIMENKSEREATLKELPEAMQLDKQMKESLGEGQNSEDFYKLASDVFADMVKEAKGDPEKLKKLLADAQANPEAFARKLSSTQKAKLGTIGKKAEDKGKSATAK